MTLLRCPACLRPPFLRSPFRDILLSARSGFLPFLHHFAPISLIDLRLLIRSSLRLFSSSRPHPSYYAKSLYRFPVRISVAFLHVRELFLPFCPNVSVFLRRVLCAPIFHFLFLPTWEFIPLGFRPPHSCCLPLCPPNLGLRVSLIPFFLLIPPSHPP